MVSIHFSLFFLLLSALVFWTPIKFFLLSATLNQTAIEFHIHYFWFKNLHSRHYQHLSSRNLGLTSQLILVKFQPFGFLSIENFLLTGSISIVTQVLSYCQFCCIYFFFWPQQTSCYSDPREYWVPFRFQILFFFIFSSFILFSFSFTFPISQLYFFTWSFFQHTSESKLSLSL